MGVPCKGSFSIISDSEFSLDGTLIIRCETVQDGCEKGESYVFPAKSRNKPIIRCSASCRGEESIYCKARLVLPFVYREGEDGAVVFANGRLAEVFAKN